MDIKLHVTDARPRKRRHPIRDGWCAGVPVKRFFTRFESLADLPPEDLEFLNEQIRLALNLSQEANISALHAAVRAELRHRESETDVGEPDE